MPRGPSPHHPSMGCLAWPKVPGEQRHSCQAGHSKGLEVLSQVLLAKGQTFLWARLTLYYDILCRVRKIISRMHLLEPLKCLVVPEGSPGLSKFLPFSRRLCNLQLESNIINYSLNGCFPYCKLKGGQGWCLLHSPMNMQGLAQGSCPTRQQALKPERPRHVSWLYQLNVWFWGIYLASVSPPDTGE